MFDSPFHTQSKPSIQYKTLKPTGALGCLIYIEKSSFKNDFFAFSPIQTVTVGPGVSPGQPLQKYATGHGLRAYAHYRRSGIAPCPENEIDILLSIPIIHVLNHIAIFFSFFMLGITQDIRKRNEWMITSPKRKSCSNKMLEQHSPFQKLFIQINE